MPGSRMALGADGGYLSRMFFNFSYDISLMSIKGGMSTVYNLSINIFPSTTEGAIFRIFMKCNDYQIFVSLYIYLLFVYCWHGMNSS